MKKGLKKQIALLLSAMMIFSTSASAFPAMAEDNLIFEKAENNTINSDDYEFYNSESEITVTTCENEENPLEMETETTTVSTTTEVSVQYIEEQTESNPVEVYNSDYAVYAVSSSDEYEQPKEGDGSESNPYKISNSSQLFWFAQQVNNGETISAVLTADIVVNDNLLNSLKFDVNGDVTNEADFEKWTPIGKKSKWYKGTFDGQNHTISGLYFNNSTSYVGLFGYNNGTIKNVGIIDSYFKGNNWVGGVCGDNSGTIANSYNTGSVSGSDNIGGVCGYNYDKIENSYNTGSVSGSKNVGGVCGQNSKTIKNSYNTGSASGSNWVGGVCGYNRIGTIADSYYNNSVYSGEAVGADTGTVNKVSGKTSGQFESGEVAFSLGGIWGQEIGKDKLPVLNGKKVYQNITYTGCCEKYQGDVAKYEYSNTEADTIYLKETHNFENGICTGCGTYEPIKPDLKDGYYQIENANHLYWFEKQVNSGNVSINAILTTDIVVNKNVLNADGTLNTDSTLTEWTPIGNELNRYSGTFDGNNHTISGLYFNDENTNCVGLFGYNSGTIKNVGMIDSYFKGKNYVSDVCGYNSTKGKIENSYNIGSVSGSSKVGGVCGSNVNGTIENSYYNNSVYSGKDVGYNYKGTVTKVTGKTFEQFANGEVAYLLGGIWGQEIGIDKLPVLNGKKVYQNIIYSGCCEKYQGDITYDYSNTQKDAVYLKETHNFKNGICTVCGIYELIEPTKKDGYYQIENVNHLYWFAHQVNSGNTDINAVLTADIIVNKNVLNADGTLNSDLALTEWTPIGNYSKKYTGTFDGKNHTISGLYFNNESTSYVGLFGCNSGTIKNIGIIDSYFKGDNCVGGVCGCNWKDIFIGNSYGTIENSYNTGSVSGVEGVGGVCGNNHINDSESKGTIANSYNTGTIRGLENVGGVSGQNIDNAIITNSYNTGTVIGLDDNNNNNNNNNNNKNNYYVGGVCGYNYDGSTIKNSYNIGLVSVLSDRYSVGGVCGYNNGTIENSYYLKNCNAEGTTFTNNDSTEKTYAQFESGEVAYLLQKGQEAEIWGQEITKDRLPVLNSRDKVYKAIAYSSIENEVISEIYLNKSLTVIMTAVAPIKEGYNFKGWYAYDESNDNRYTGDILSSSRKYDIPNNITADSEFMAVYEPLGTADITINCDREYTVNGVSKSSATTEKYSIGSTIKLSCSDENFAYWQNSAGTILSRENEYSFVVTNEETISAVFNEVVENKVTLIFESFYGQVIATEQLGSGEKMVTPDLPVRTGYNALGWDFDGDGKFTENDTLENAIEIGLKLDSRTVKIVPVYELIDTTHRINVINGTGSGAYKKNDIVTATPNKAETGMKFSHWEDSDGNILSYNEKYVFYVSKNMTVKAVYVKTETKIDAKGTTGIVELNKTTNNKLSFVSMSTVPEGCKINKAGIIATDDSKLANSSEFTDKNAKFVRGMSSNKKAVRYTWTKGNVKSGQTWYVRAYLVYTDSNGNVHTVYGDMVSRHIDEI